MKIKRISLLALIVAFTLTLAAGLGIVGKSTAKAADESGTPAATFEMTTGASLRLSGDADGIRFRVRMDETLAGKVKSGEIALKFVISTKYSFDNAAGDYAGIAKKLEIAVDKNKVYLGSADRPDEAGYYFANAVMTELKETSRKIDFVAVAYYTDAEGKTVYATIPADNQRSMYGVINTLVTEKGETYAQEILSAAVYNWYGTGVYPITLKTQAQCDGLSAAVANGASLSGRNVIADSALTLPANLTAIVKSVTDYEAPSGQEIVLSDASGYTVNLGDYASASVLDATLGGEPVSYADGKVILPAAYKQNTQKHGKQQLNLLVEKDGNYYNVKANLLVVTKEITTLDELKSALYLGVSDNDSVRYGYYRLMKDLSTNGGWYMSGYKDLAGLASNPEKGFRGTFDGNGKKIEAFVYEPGIFGIIGNGAVIKNFTVAMSRYESKFMALGFSMIGATLENVTISAKAGKSSDGTVYDGVTEIPKGSHGGLVTSVGAYNNVFKNVTVNASDVNVDTLFGSCSNNFVYPADVTNTFENCTVNVKSLIGLACINNAGKTVTTAVGVNGLIVNVPKADVNSTDKIIVGQNFVYSLADISEISGIKLNGNDFTAYSFSDGTLTINAEAFGVADVGDKTFAITAKTGKGYVVNFNLYATVEFVATPVDVSGTKEVVLGSGNEYELDLGEYSDATVLSATLGGEAVTYANGTLTLTDAYKQNEQKHGEQPLKLVVEKGGNYYNVTATALVVTKEIATFDDLEAAVTLNENHVKYGYYRLTQNLSNNVETSYGKNYKINGKDIWRYDGEYGFRGTFDGNNLTLSSKWSVMGIFGVLGRGAVVKNVTIEHKEYISARLILGYVMIGTTLQNVTVNVSGAGTNTIPASAVGGLLTAIVSYDSTLENVTINANNTAIDTLFGNGRWYGNYPDGHKKNVFTDCFVNAKSLYALSCVNGDANNKWSYDGVEHLTVTITG